MTTSPGFNLLLSALSRAEQSGEDDSTHAKRLAFQALASDLNALFMSHHIDNGGTLDTFELTSALMTLLGGFAQDNNINPISLLGLFVEAYNVTGEI